MTINPQQTIFYSIDHAIKEYRKFAQKNISQVVKDVTLDQMLVLTILDTEPEISQKSIAKILFKDYASITRIVELLVKKEYLQRNIHEEDRRKFHLSITKNGQSTIKKLRPIILQNRSDALNGVTDEQIDFLNTILNNIINNCSN